MRFKKNDVIKNCTTYFLLFSANEQGFAMLGDLKIVKPGTDANLPAGRQVEKQMYKITTKSPPMLVLPEQLLLCC